MKYLYILLGSIFWVTPAYAYLDPGTGSLLIQSAIALVAGAFFAIKTYWYKIKSYFSRENDVDLNQDKDQDEE